MVVNENRSIVTSNTSADVTVKAPFRRFIEPTDDRRASNRRQGLKTAVVGLPRDAVTFAVRARRFSLVGTRVGDTRRLNVP